MCGWTYFALKMQVIQLFRRCGQGHMIYWGIIPWWNSNPARMTNFRTAFLRWVHLSHLYMFLWLQESYCMKGVYSRVCICSSQFFAPSSTHWETRASGLNREKSESAKGFKNTCWLPWSLSGEESACQCKRHRHGSWSGKNSHTAEKLRPWATTIRAMP